jgi:hypothetical protein
MTPQMLSTDQSLAVAPKLDLLAVWESMPVQAKCEATACDTWVSPRFHGTRCRWHGGNSVKDWTVRARVWAESHG